MVEPVQGFHTALSTFSDDPPFCWVAVQMTDQGLQVV